MMDYEVFKNVITERIKAFLPPIYAEFNVSVMKVPKINGMREAMVLDFESENYRMSGPNIYLDELYEEFSAKGDLDEILHNTAGVIIGFTGTQDFSKDEYLKLKAYKQYVVQMLINTEMNKELLEKAPHKDFFDLSLIYRLAIPDADGNGCTTALITHEMMKEMGLDEESLDELAEENSRKNLKTQVFPMMSLLSMMTTEAKMYGAINLLRLDEIKKVADEMDGNLYLLPSSVHDIMAIKENPYNKEEGLFEMLRAGNEKCNDADENLSLNIYYYNRAEDRLEIRYCSNASDA